MLKPSVWKDVAEYIAKFPFVFSLESPFLSGSHKHSWGLHIDDHGFTCREEFVQSIRGHLLHCAGAKFDSDDKAINLGSKIDLFHESTRAPGSTILLAGMDHCMQPMCAELCLHTLNTLVALPATLLNPDRYLGDWWVGQPENLRDPKKTMWSEEFFDSKDALTYYGVDNTILYHPALLTTIIGLLRQALAMHRLGLTQGLVNAVPPKELVKAISKDDTATCLRLFKAARPWLEANGKQEAFPIRKGDWNLFLNLHKALYKHGFEGVFGSVEEGWSLQDHYMKYDGFKTYFNRGRQLKVEELAKKAA